jgi:hypothetical protein
LIDAVQNCEKPMRFTRSIFWCRDPRQVISEASEKGDRSESF